jgi:putative membrane protein
MRFLSWVIVNAVSLMVALWLIPGIYISGPTHGSDEFRHKLWRLVIVAIIFGVINAIIRPILTIVSLPAIILTLGLFILVINAALLGLTAWIAGHTTLAFHVNGFWAAVWGGLIMALVAMIVKGVLGKAV